MLKIGEYLCDMHYGLRGLGHETTGTVRISVEAGMFQLIGYLDEVRRLYNGTRYDNKMLMVVSGPTAACVDYVAMALYDGTDLYVVSIKDPQGD